MPVYSEVKLLRYRRPVLRPPAAQDGAGAVRPHRPPVPPVRPAARPRPQRLLPGHTQATKAFP